MSLIEKCICGCQDFKIDEHNLISVNICLKCGVMHQRLEEMTKEGYFDFYIKRYHDGCYTHTYEQDLKVAKLRKIAYEDVLRQDSVILDIGSGNNAFVDEMASSGFKIYGVELSCASNHTNVYKKDLFDIHFPPSSFDMITLHDVLEHFLDPKKYLEECYKILKANGTLIIDFPDFFSEHGRHHWKRIEHLWFINLDQLLQIVKRMGFRVDRINRPVNSKLVLYLSKGKIIPCRKMLFMPGMGDIYWPLTKMESFIKNHNLGVPKAYIWVFGRKIIKVHGRQRSEGYLERIPFLEYCGIHEQPLRRPKDPYFDQFYKHKTNMSSSEWNIKIKPTWYIQNFPKFHYVFNMNGILEIGRSIENDFDLNKYDSDWFFPIFTPIEEYFLEEQYQEKYGNYIFCYFTGVGLYSERFNKILSPNRIYELLLKIHEQTKYNVVLTGVEWDQDINREIMSHDRKGFIFSEVNQTTVSQLYALMKGSVGVFGWAAGNTIMSTYFKKPTIMGWSSMWHRDFAFNSVSPAALNKWYFPFHVEELKDLQNLVDTGVKVFK